MEISGSYRFSAPAAEVWAKFMDPQVLTGCLPGVDSLELVGPNSYQAAMDIRVGPVRSKYTAKFTLHDLEEPVSYRMTLEASGPLGFSSGEARVTLAEAGDVTEVIVEGEAQIGGAVARVGQRMMGSVAQGMMDRMFSCFQEALAAPRG